MNRTLPFALLALGTLTACQTTPPNPTTFNFNRPSGAAQVCVDIETTAEGRLLTDDTGQFLSTPIPQPLWACATANTAMPASMGNGHFHAFRMFSLVTQSDRGELAVVNLHPTYNTGIVDNDPLIPGFTFIPVGAFPGAVTVHPDGSAIYVANTGENTVSIVDTTTILRTQTAGAGSLGGVIRFTGLDGRRRPADVAIGQIDGGRIFLFATLPDTGEVAYVDVTNSSQPGTPEYIPLGARLTGGLDGGIGGDGGSIDGGADGGTTGSYRPERIAIANVDLTANGTPGNLDRIYVSDSRASLVHTIQLMPGGTMFEETDPLTTLSPNRAITVTPTILTTDPPRRFVYVGGADDGTLTVLDTITRAPVVVNATQADPACQEGTPSFDANACHRIDAKVSLYNVPIKSSVISLTTVTRDAIDPNRCTTRVAAPAGALAPSNGNSDACPMDGAFADEGAASINTIRGVAVIAGLRDGTLRIIDVEDWQAYCSPDRRASSSQANPAPQRHLPRLATAYPDPSTLMNGVTTPSYAVNGNLTTPTDSDPHMTDLHLPMSNGVVDPLRVHDDTWVATFEGAIPGLTLRVGSLQDVGNLHLHADVPGAGFCTRGALADDIATLADPSPCVGDPVDMDAGPRVLPDPALCNAGGPPDSGMTVCSQVFGTATAPCHRRLRITDLTETSITVTPDVEPTACSTITAEGQDLVNLIRQCYPQAVLLSVRTGNAWTVSAATAGYVHTVTEDPTTHECVAHSPNPGRLFEGTPYDGPGFSATITAGTMPSQLDSSYSFSISGGLLQLLVPGGLVPTTLMYSCPSRRIYIVDQARASLVEYPVAPIATPRTFN